jgi:hypothetical protein
MTPDPLPPDLLALERELAARPRMDASAELRSRVLAAAEQELPGLRPASAPAGFARFAAATAAAALLAINLSASVANDTDWRLITSRADVANIAANVRALDPDVTDREAVRQAILMRAAAGLTPAPVPTADHVLSHKDLE